VPLPPVGAGAGAGAFAVEYNFDAFVVVFCVRRDLSAPDALAFPNANVEVVIFHSIGR
jgi:hypothetical protein